MFQGSTEHNSFYHVKWIDLQNGPYFLNSNSHDLNFGLPNEIIEKIIRYLGPHSFVALANSQLFLPALLKLNYFYQALNSYFNHTLCKLFWIDSHFTHRFKHFIYNNEFYFIMTPKMEKYLRLSPIIEFLGPYPKLNFEVYLKDFFSVFHTKPMFKQYQTTHVIGKTLKSCRLCYLSTYKYVCAPQNNQAMLVPLFQQYRPVTIFI